uniref:Uncharacterized protein n=1 Tax=Ditylenchus dipsaci TaxID=166011 RepID=A0A915DIV3_9BILA
MHEDEDIIVVCVPFLVHRCKLQITALPPKMLRCLLVKSEEKMQLLEEIAGKSDEVDGIRNSWSSAVLKILIQQIKQCVAGNSVVELSSVDSLDDLHSAVNTYERVLGELRIYRLSGPRHHGVASQVSH